MADSPIDHTNSSFYLQARKATIDDRKSEDIQATKPTAVDMEKFELLSKGSYKWEFPLSRAGYDKLLLDLPEDIPLVSI